MLIKGAIRFLFLIVFFASTVSQSYAQNTIISGKVVDVLTNEPIPFANIAFKGTSIGTVTDINGRYQLSTDQARDSLTASFVGYTSVTLPVKKGKTNTINFFLEVNKIQLAEVKIVAGENPADIIMRKVIDNKDINRKQNFETYQYESYNKVEFDLTNITEEFKNNKLIKPFAFIFDKIDSSESNERPFLPIFISETMSDVYYRQKPESKREYIKASKVSGFENNSVTQFLGDLYQNADIYQNYMELFQKSFVSPISNSGFLFYRYYLVDSAMIGDYWCYKIKFKPKRKQELTFIGDCWIHDSTFAVRKINMRIAEDANINFVHDLAIVRDYERFINTAWMLTNEQIVVDFNIKEKGMSFIGRKTTSYKKIKLNEPIDEEKFKPIENIVVDDEAMLKDDSYWNIARHDSLNQREQDIYHMVDTIRSLPAFKTYVDIITLFFTGYKKFGPIELGPYYTFFSFNPIEGPRFRLGGRTSDDFSTKIEFNGYLAYGTKDEKFKYKIGTRLFLSQKPRTILSLHYKDDIVQLGQSENAFQDDNFLTSILRTSPPDKLTRIKEVEVYYDHEWFPGLSNRVTFNTSEQFPLGSLDYSYYTNTEHTAVRNNLSLTEISLFTRFWYREKFAYGKTGRISLGSKYPLVQLRYKFSLENFLNSDFTYQRFDFKLSDSYKINPIGQLDYTISAGAVFGTVPFPLLSVHNGNESYFFDYLAFNMMNYYEFISDRYTEASITHHFEGLFFNRVPLFRKLKWREVVHGRAALGEMQKSNKDLLVDQNSFFTLGKPYVEAGVGIENILKIFRLDYVWRLSYLNHPDISRSGLRFSLQLTF
ncbi:MAG TPA: DUF5686 family protein [Bacteroidia bacterium]|nr:DUF5686 family protein [Bacteroidia bacterium]HNT80015.1 DUF5686 family protein [Bacteroidia bacterium]